MSKKLKALLVKRSFWYAVVKVVLAVLLVLLVVYLVKGCDSKSNKKCTANPVTTTPETTAKQDDITTEVPDTDTKTDDITKVPDTDVKQDEFKEDLSITTILECTGKETITNRSKEQVIEVLVGTDFKVTIISTGAPIKTYKVSDDSDDIVGLFSVDKVSDYEWVLTVSNDAEATGYNVFYLNDGEYSVSVWKVDPTTDPKA